MEDLDETDFRAFTKRRNTIGFASNLKNSVINYRHSCKNLSFLQSPSPNTSKSHLKVAGPFNFSPTERALFKRTCTSIEAPFEEDNKNVVKNFYTLARRLSMWNNNSKLKSSIVEVTIEDEGKMTESDFVDSPSISASSNSN